MAFFSRWFGGGRRWSAFDGGNNNGSELGGVGAGSAGGAAAGTGGPGAAGTAALAAATPFEYAPLPKERIGGVRGLFTWNAWMGISIIQYLFVLAYCLVGIFCFLAIAQAVLSGSAGYAILYLVLAPIWMLILTMAFRLLSELCISVLMAPHLLEQNHKDLVRLLQEQLHNQQQQQATHCPESELEGGQRGGNGGGSRPGSGSFRGIGGSGSGRRGPITAGDLEEEEIGINMATV